MLDPGKHDVSKDGKLINLTPLSYQFLLVLIENVPYVVNQDKLIELVWPGRVITPETLTRRIKIVRQGIGDDADAPSYVGLVRGEGYRLIAWVDPLDKTETKQAPTRRKMGVLPFYRSTT